MILVPMGHKTYKIELQRVTQVSPNVCTGVTGRDNSVARAIQSGAIAFPFWSNVRVD